MMRAVLLRLPLVRRGVLPGLALVAGLACVPVVAEAQTPPSLTAQSEAQARFQTGLKYYDARDFESARLAFTQAYAVLQKPAILLNLALSELYTNRPLDAANHLDRYLAETDLPADKRERAKKAYEEAARKVGHLAIKVLPGTEVRVDGVAVTPPVPALVHVAPGTRVLDATRGKGTRSVTVAAVAGETLEVDLKIDEGAVGVGAAGVVTKTVTAPPAEPGAGVGGGVGAGAGVTPPPPVEGERGTFLGWRSITGLAAVGVGGIGLVLGLVAHGDANEADDRVSQLQAQLPSSGSSCVGSSSAACAEAARAASDRDDARSRSNLFLIGGGVFVAAGAGLLVSSILWPHKKTSAVARLAPGPTAAGLSFVTTY